MVPNSVAAMYGPPDIDLGLALWYVKRSAQLAGRAGEPR